MQKLEISVDQKVEELKERIILNETKVVQNVVKEVKSHGESSDSEEQKEIDARRSNMIIYRVQEIDSEVVDDRKSGDALFVHELCNDILKIPLQSGDVEKMFSPGRREDGKERPLLIRFSSEKKMSVMSRVKELKGAPERYRKISIAHDLTPRQREVIKELRRKALDELEKDKDENEGGSTEGNYRIIVVGQQTMKPRAVRVPLRN